MSDAPDYTPPKVWTWNKASGGRFANINRPVAGPTHDRELPVGRHPLQLAWVELGVPQCGYCQSGQIMQAAALLKTNAKQSVEDIETAMSGHICRCGTYTRIKAAIQQAAAKGA